MQDIHKENFHVYGGKCLSRKAIHNWVADVSLMTKRLVETEARKWLIQQPKDFYAAGFDALVKRWDKCISVGGGYVEKLMFSSRFEYHMFYVLYPFVAYLLALPPTSITQ
jgi:hypothetical protein